MKMTEVNLLRPSQSFTRARLCLCIVGMASLLTSCGERDGAQVSPEPSGAAAPAAVIAEIGAWRAGGGVQHPSNLVPRPSGTNSRNAADMYRSISSAFANLPSSDVEMMRDPWSASVRSLEYLLESFERELAVIHDAIEVPYCNWETPLTESRTAAVEYLTQVRAMGRLLVVQAIVRADQNDLDGAAMSLVAIMRLGDQAASESHTIGIQMRQALDALATDTVRRIFESKDIIPPVIAATLDARDYRAYVRRSLIHEGSLAIQAVRKAAGGDATGPIDQQPIPQDLADGLVWYLSTMRSFIEQSSLPYYEQTTARQVKPMPASARLPDGLSTFEDIERICKVAASVENQTNVARLAIRLRGHRAAHGAYPDSANFEVPNDALTGRPIEYWKYTDKIVLRGRIAGLRGESSEYEWEW